MPRCPAAPTGTLRRPFQSEPFSQIGAARSASAGNCKRERAGHGQSLCRSRQQLATTVRRDSYHFEPKPECAEVFPKVPGLPVMQPRSLECPKVVDADAEASCHLFERRARARPEQTRGAHAGPRELGTSKRPFGAPHRPGPPSAHRVGQRTSRGPCSDSPSAASGGTTCRLVRAISQTIIHPLLAKRAVLGAVPWRRPVDHDHNSHLTSTQAQSGACRKARNENGTCGSELAPADGDCRVSHWRCTGARDE